MHSMAVATPVTRDSVTGCSTGADCCIDLADLGLEVKYTKKASTAKGYLAVLKHLEIYCGKKELRLEEISTEFVEGFGRYLVDEGLSAATVGLYKRSLRALLKDAFGREGANVLKSAFAGVASSNETETMGITSDELREVADACLTESPWLRRVRDVFMLCVYGCGLSFAELKHRCEEGADIAAEDIFEPYAAGRWMREAAIAFGATNGIGLLEYIGGLSEETYRQGLAAIGVLLRLKHPLTEKSAVDGWIATARALGFGSEAIVGGAAVETAYRKIVGRMTADDVTAAAEEAACKVAAAITDLSERWYAMRCFSATPDETAPLVQKIAVGRRRIETFVPSVGNGKHSDAADRMMDKMLFFRCRASEAVKVKKSLGRSVHVFSFSDSDRTPAFICADEMMAFMFLADVAGDTIRYFFPDEISGLPPFAISERVTVTNGKLMGHVGVIDKIGKDRLRVVVKIEALNGAMVTAEIPIKFLNRTTSEIR